MAYEECNTDYETIDASTNTNFTSEFDYDQDIQSSLNGSETPGMFWPALLKHLQEFDLSNVEELHYNGPSSTLQTPICDTLETYDEDFSSNNPFKRKASLPTPELQSETQDIPCVILPLSKFQRTL